MLLVSSGLCCFHVRRIPELVGLSSCEVVLVDPHLVAHHVQGLVQFLDLGLYVVLVPAQQLKSPVFIARAVAGQLDVLPDRRQ